MIIYSLFKYLHFLYIVYLQFKTEECQKIPRKDTPVEKSQEVPVPEAPCIPSKSHQLGKFYLEN